MKFNLRIHFYNLFLLISLFLSSLVFSQNRPFLFETTSKELNVSLGEIKTLVLKFDNNSNDTINATIKLPLDLGLNFYSNEVLRFKVNPHKKSFIPLKFSIKKQQLASEILLPLKVIDTQTLKEIASYSQKIDVNFKKDVNLIPIQNNHFYKQDRRLICLLFN